MSSNSISAPPSRIGRSMQTALRTRPAPRLPWLTSISAGFDHWMKSRRWQLSPPLLPILQRHSPRWPNRGRGALSNASSASFRIRGCPRISQPHSIAPGWPVIRKSSLSTPAFWNSWLRKRITQRRNSWSQTMANNFLPTRSFQSGPRPWSSIARVQFSRAWPCTNRVSSRYGRRSW